MKWNYRLGTKLIKNIWYGTDGPEGVNSHNRTFIIIKCFYIDSIDEEPYTFSKVTLMESPDVDKIKWELDELQKIFKAPILDIDNFPKIHTDE